MNDERIVEVIAETIYNEQFHGWDAAEGAELVLEALRGAGFDVYRPDDCNEVIQGEKWFYAAGPEHLPPGTYRLVPVGGDS